MSRPMVRGESGGFLGAGGGNLASSFHTSAVCRNGGNAGRGRGAPRLRTVSRARGRAGSHTERWMPPGVGLEECRVGRERARMI